MIFTAAELLTCSAGRYVTGLQVCLSHRNYWYATQGSAGMLFTAAEQLTCSAGRYVTGSARRRTVGMPIIGSAVVCHSQFLQFLLWYPSHTPHIILRHGREEKI
jgi:uncharacterized protein (DUF169 family)